MSKFNKIFKSPWYGQVQRLRDICVLLKTLLYYRLVFASVGSRTKVYKPLRLVNPQWVKIGSRSLIRHGIRIEMLAAHGRTPSLVIGNNVNIEQNVHLVCSAQIWIGDNVSIAPCCGILDTSHPADEVDESSKIGDRLNEDPLPIVIGDNTLIGYGVVILPGVKIGRHCVIGANSVVNRDIPDYSIAAGAPARVVRSLSKASGQ